MLVVVLSIQLAIESFVDLFIYRHLYLKKQNSDNRSSPSFYD